MKYREAIDMILDGGETYRKSRPEYKQKFMWWSNLCGHYLSKLSGALWSYGFIIDKEDFTATDWIVEKDGVVYEEYQMPTKTLVGADPVELNTACQIQIDEDWLEKKMLCFMRRHFLLEPNALQFCKSCRDKDCPFCFPADKDADHIPDVSKKVTFYELSGLINELRETAYTKGACEVNYMYDEELEKLACLEEKLKYLVSLRGK